MENRPVGPFSDRLFDAMQHLNKTERANVSGAELGRRVAALLDRAPFSEGWFTMMKDSPTPPPNPTCLAIAQICGVDPGWLTYGEACAAPMLPQVEPAIAAGKGSMAAPIWAFPAAARGKPKAKGKKAG